jgi:hypothetical protein
MMSIIKVAYIKGGGVEVVTEFVKETIILQWNEMFDI